MTKRPGLDRVLTHLHRRVLAGDEYAREEVCRLLTPLCRENLRRWFRRHADQPLVDEAVHDALVGYLRHPERYRPDAAGLTTYVTMLARSLARSASRADGRCRIREEQAVAGERQAMEPDHDVRLDGEAIIDRLVGAGCDSGERAFVEAAFLHGERRADRLVALLGREGLDVAQQRQLVQRLLDKYRRRLYRLRRELTGRQTRGGGVSSLAYATMFGRPTKSFLETCHGGL